VPPIPHPPEQVNVVVTEEALGLPVSDRASLVALVEELPFELVMILVSPCKANSYISEPTRRRS
jgi:hypothetical protein